MSTKANMSLSTAATTESEAFETARSIVESLLKDNVDKVIKLEKLVKYIKQVKDMPAEEYIKVSKFFLSQLILEFEGDDDYFLPWVRFLDIAHVQIKNCKEDADLENFKSGIVEILASKLLKDEKIKSIDWRIARKVLSLQEYFSLKKINVQHVKEGVLKALKAEIDIALEYLLWLKDSLFVILAKEILLSLCKYLDNPVDQDQDQGQNDLLEAVLCGRFDKDKFGFKNSLILGEDGGLYVLLNRMNLQQQDALVAEQIMTRDYLKDKIKAKDEVKGDKIVLGTGGFGTVRFALSLLRNKSLPAEIVCVKKTKAFQKLTDGYVPPPLEKVTESILDDYFTNDRAQAIYSPCILDMALVTNKNMSEGEKDHRKGYVMMEVLPQNTATRVFDDERYQKWEYQKPYLLGVLENAQTLLEHNIAMTDLKPDNTLYDVDTRKATIIDLGGSIKVANSGELDAFDVTKYSFQTTAGFKAPELEGAQGVVNMHRALAYSCGKVIEAITRKSDNEEKTISQIIEKLTILKPEDRISIPKAISEIKQIDRGSYTKNIIFSHYINKVKDRIENKKSAVNINKDIDKTRELFITLNATTADPSRFQNLETKDLFEKIDNFLAFGNPKQVMAIFGVAGSGKSIALQLKFIEAVYAWQPGQPLPIYFNLANGLDLDHIVRTLNIELGTNLNLKDLDEPHLYVDSFDEGLGIEDKKKTLIKEYFKQLQGSPKILITCRTDYLHGNSDDWFSPDHEDKKLEVCYVAPINSNDLPKMVEKYVCYSKKKDSSIQHSTEDYLNRLNELHLTDLINTGFMFFLIMEVLFQLQDITERRVNKLDIYAKYISHYQNSQIAHLKNQGQKQRLTEMTLLLKSSQQSQQSSLYLFATELGKYLSCQMHLEGQSRLDNLYRLFAALGYQNSLLLKHQSIIHMLKLLPLKIMTTHSGKRLISNQEVKISFIHDTIKNYYLVEAIKSEIEKEGKSQILSSKSIVHDIELVKLIVIAMKNNPEFTDSFLKAIENSKHDKSTPSIIHASNSISLLVAAKHSFSGYDLSNIAIKGASIANGIFHNTNLDNSDLSCVDMRNVNLKGSSLNGADMRGVNFSDLVGPVLDHSGVINSVSFSPDSNLLASGSTDKSIKIWNPNTKECLQILNGHTDTVTSLSFSPNLKLLASGSLDNTIKIWNASTGKCLLTLDGHYSGISSISFSPNGKSLASGSLDNTIKIWDPSTGECLLTLCGHNLGVTSVSFSPDGKLIASGSLDNTIQIWEPSARQCLQTLDLEKDNVYSSPISRQNRSLVGVCSVSFSPDGKFLASGSSDATIKIWDLWARKCESILDLEDVPSADSSPSNHKPLMGVCSVSFSPDSNFLAGSKNTTIKIWNPSTRKCLKTLTRHTDAVNSVSFSPDGRFLASGSFSDIEVLNLRTGQCLQTLDGHLDVVRSVSFSPDGKFLATGSGDETVKIWDSSSGDCLQTLNEHTIRVNSVSFSPDGRFLASGSYDKTVKIWNTSTGKCLKTLQEHAAVSSVSFSPDGKFLASGSSFFGTIKIWGLCTLECVQTLNRNPTYISSLSFSPDSKFLANGSQDKIVNIWDVSTGECLKTLNGHRDAVNSVSFSPDGMSLASGSWDETIKIWNPSTGECLQTLKGHTLFVYSVSFSPDGKSLASGSWDQTIKIWNLNTGECLHTLHAHEEGVSSVSFSPDGRFLASGARDQTVKIFKFEARSNVWLLKNNIMAKPSPLLAHGATLKKTIISDNNRIVLTQKDADTKFSTIDNTIDHTKHHRESNHITNQFSQDLLEKFIILPESQDSKLVTLSKPVAFSINPPVHEFQHNPNLKQCCQIFANPKIIYDNPLLNLPALFTQISQILGPIQTLNLKYE